MFADCITKLVLPAIQDEILLQVTFITKVNMFNAVICDEYQRSSDKVQIKRIDVEDGEETGEKGETLVTLNNYLNEEHNVKALKRCTVLPPLGQIVVACYIKDGRFYRARVVDYLGEEKICVFHVDYGNKGPPLRSSGQSSWLQIRRPGFKSLHYQKKSSGSGTGSTQPCEYN
jgi:hypothetical protein